MIGLPAPTRRELLVGGAVGGGVVLLAAASAQAAQAPAHVSVTARLQRLIRIELLLLVSYRHVLASSVLTPGLGAP